MKIENSKQLCPACKVGQDKYLIYKEVDKLVGTQKENPTVKRKTTNGKAAQANSRCNKKD